MWAQPAFARAHTHVIQLPHHVSHNQGDGDGDARRSANIKRLQEYHQRRADEKIGQLEQELLKLQETQNSLALVLSDEAFEQMELAQQEIDVITTTLRRLRAKRLEDVSRSSEGSKGGLDAVSGWKGKPVSDSLCLCAPPHPLLSLSFVCYFICLVFTFVEWSIYLLIFCMHLLLYLPSPSGRRWTHPEAAKRS